MLEIQHAAAERQFLSIPYHIALESHEKSLYKIDLVKLSLRISHGAYLVRMFNQFNSF